LDLDILARLGALPPRYDEQYAKIFKMWVNSVLHGNQEFYIRLTSVCTGIEKFRIRINTVCIGDETFTSDAQYLLQPWAARGRGFIPG
jgi:hypothetical protein